MASITPQPAEPLKSLQEGRASPSSGSLSPLDERIDDLKGSIGLPAASAQQNFKDRVIRVVTGAGSLDQLIYLFGKATKKEMKEVNWGETLTAAAARGGNLETVRYLLSQRKFDKEDLAAAVQCAAKRGDTDMVLLLLEKHKLSKEGLKEALSSALANGKEETALCLLIKGPLSPKDFEDFNQRIMEGRPPTKGWIHLAAEKGYSRATRLLLEKYNSFDRDALASVMVTALQNGHEEVALSLLPRASFSNPKTFDMSHGPMGSAAVYWAAKNGQPRALKQILERLEYLYGRGPTEKEAMELTLQSALSASVENKDPQALHVILDFCPRHYYALSTEDLSRVVQVAIEKGDKNLVQKCLDRINVPPPTWNGVESQKDSYNSGVSSMQQLVSRGKALAASEEKGEIAKLIEEWGNRHERKRVPVTQPPRSFF